LKQQKFDGKILIVGFGSIGQGVLPLLLRHFSVPPEKITIVTADKRGRSVAKAFGVHFILEPLTPDNYGRIVLSHIGRGDFLCNVSVNVSSTDLITLCQENGILYLDTVVEPWAGYYTDASLSMSERSNYALREKVLSLRNLPITGPRPTAVVAHGANPGLVSHFVKGALLKIAKDTDEKIKEPKTRDEWARLAQQLGIKVIHIAERDTQAPKKPKKMDEFVNTWSVDGFYSEGCQPSEMGWGTHEKHMPERGRRHDFGCKAAIYLGQPGLATQVRSWTPISGAQYGWVITHNESISIADYLTVRDGGRVVYRPTVHYAYHPCDGAVLSLLETAERGGTLQNISRLISNEILPGGVDELGVLLMGHKKNALWYGSRLSIDEARVLAPYNNATGLQVCAGILGAMIWAIRNPNAGILDADELDHHVVMEAALPYLGTMLAEYTDWTPIAHRGDLFPEKLDKKDPWQFNNFLVA
jgi:homospermidine synthase